MIDPAALAAGSKHKRYRTRTRVVFTVTRTGTERTITPVLVGTLTLTFRDVTFVDVVFTMRMAVNLPCA